MTTDSHTRHVRDAVRDLLREDHLDHANQCFAQQRWEAGIGPVSYTHLTLPTILLV